MKVKFNQKTVKNQVFLGGSAVAGGVVSRIASSSVLKGVDSPLVKGGIALGSLLLAGSIQGNSSLVTAFQGALLGVGIEQAESALRASFSDLKEKENPTSSDKMIKTALGMNAVGQEVAFYSPKSEYLPEYQPLGEFWDDSLNEASKGGFSQE